MKCDIIITFSVLFLIIFMADYHNGSTAVNIL